LDEELHAQFVEQGYAGPVRVLEAQRCREILDRLSHDQPEPSDWHKGHAASSSAFYDLARHPAIIGRVSSLLGDDVMLWGASIQTRVPGAKHPWHTDIEISTASGKSVSVWIGLEHTVADSSLSIVPYSHRFGVTVQETAHRFGKRRKDIADEDVLRWAMGHDPRSGIMKVEMGDGEAVLCDGALWHGSHNLSHNTRRALLLQYATPDTPIRIPDLDRLEWPFRLLDAPRPPCIMVRGRGGGDANRIVAAPSAPATNSPRRLSSRVYPLRIPLAPDDAKGWKPYPIFRGRTAAVRGLTCHASVLNHDQCPHPPHRHDEEEILIVLAGEVDIVVPDLGSPERGGRVRLRPGQFAYYPAQFAHTLRTVSEEPANYLMFKWQSGPASAGAPLGFGRFDALGLIDAPTREKGFRAQLLLEGPTACLRKLHSHASTLIAGAGYSPHVDAHDVAIVVLEGEIETLEERVGPYSVIFYPAGESHGMSNPGDTAARYVVFEFHGDGTSARDTSANAEIPRAHKLVDPRRWRATIGQLVKRMANGGE
jgi:quercetin dioxygenase-like cupin family protein